MANQSAPMPTKPDPAYTRPGFTPSQDCQDLDRDSTAYWDHRSNELKEKELESVRSAAGTWRTIVSGFAGAGVILAAIAATDKLQKLENRWEVAAGAVLLLALVFVIASLFEFGRAEAGPLKLRLNSAENTCKLCNVEPVEIARATQRGKLLALLSLTLYLSAMLGIAYGAKEPLAAAAFATVSKDDRAVCGTLQSDPQGTLVLIPQVKDPSSASPIAIKPGAELQKVESCGTEE